MNDKKYQILLTNDDGIESPGLWAAARALSEIGYVTVAAPREQSSGAGRSMPPSADGRIEKRTLQIGEEHWEVYAVGGTPALAVVFGVLQIMVVQPDLIVSGINYGENPGTDITISGTVGAAMEGAAFGIPSIAVSLQLANVNAEYLKYSRSIDFSTAGHFTQIIARKLLEKQFPHEVDLVKIDVPLTATPQTEWKLTRLSHRRYFIPVIEQVGSESQSGVIGSRYDVKMGDDSPDTDIQTLLIQHKVAVTPLSLDMTARVDLADLESKLKQVK